jgi:protein-L-isoaspartate(D-aspartate) O-methyltransferase
MKKDALIEELVKACHIKSSAVKKAFASVSREDFLPDGQRMMAYADTPLPIPAGQTISAPSMIAIMLEVAELKPGMKVLEVGAGSGYNAALIAEIVGQENVVTVERLPELVAFAGVNLRKGGYGKVRVVKGDGTLGFKEGAPYDRIIVTAAAPKISKHWVGQLKAGGLIIAPVGGRGFYQELTVAKKGKDGSLTEREEGGCVFVPLIGEEGWPG